MKDFVSIPSAFFEYEKQQIPFFKKMKIRIKFVLYMLHILLGFLLYVRCERLRDAGRQSFDNFRSFLNND